jgi:hypothetical protein
MLSEREADGGSVNTADEISIPPIDVHHPFFTRAPETRAHVIDEGKLGSWDRTIG